MQLKFKAVILISAILLLNRVDAGVIWQNSTEADPTRVVSVASYYDGSGSNFIVEIQLDTPVQFDCGTPSQSNRLIYWRASENIRHNLRLAPALTAKASGKSIDVLFNNTSCYAIDGVGVPRWEGIRLRPF